MGNCLSGKGEVSPVVNNNNNNRNGGSGDDSDGEGLNDFLFFIEMESDTDEVGQRQSKSFNTNLHLQNVKSPLYMKTSGKIQLQLHFCKNYYFVFVHYIQCKNNNYPGLMIYTPWGLHL